MYPLAKEGDILTLCQFNNHSPPPVKGDWVVFDNGSVEIPLIKRVIASAVDRLSFKKQGTRWQLLVNDKPQSNSAGKPYTLSPAQQKMLTLYGAVLPANTLLVMSENSQSAHDSRRFGLVDIRDVIALLTPTQNKTPNP